MAILVFNNVSGNLYIVCAEVKQIPKKINNRYISSSALICVGQSYIEYMQQIAIIILENFIKGGIFMRFVDYKCSDCQSIFEIVLMSDNGSEITCEKCGSSNMVRIFAPVCFKSSSGSSDSGDFSKGSQSSCRSCSGASCSTCSGCG